jgi:hypothetical protein
MVGSKRFAAAVFAAGASMLGFAPDHASAQFGCILSSNGVIRYSYQQSISTGVSLWVEEVTTAAVQDRVKSVSAAQKRSLWADVILASYTGNPDGCPNNGCDFSIRTPTLDQSSFDPSRSALEVRGQNTIQLFDAEHHWADAHMGVSGDACIGSTAPAVTVYGLGGNTVMSVGNAPTFISARALSGSYQTQCYCFWDCDNPYSYYADNGVGGFEATDSYVMYVAAGRNPIKVVMDATGGLSSSTQKNNTWTNCIKITCIGTPAELNIESTESLVVAVYNLGAGATPSNPVLGTLSQIAGSEGGGMATGTSSWSGTGMYSSVNSATPWSSSSQCYPGSAFNTSWSVSAAATPTHKEFTVNRTSAYILVVYRDAKGAAN